MVRPFARGDKDDAHDAQAIWTAVQQPGVKTVAVKSEEQKGVLALHRMPQQLVKFRTAEINCLRGLLAEHGAVIPRGRAGMRRDMASALERVSQRLPGLIVETLREQGVRVTDLDGEIDKIERRLTVWHRQTLASRRIARSRVSTCGALPPRSPRWAIRQRSGRDGSSPPGSVSFLDTPARVDGYGCSASRSVGIPIFERC